LAFRGWRGYGVGVYGVEWIWGWGLGGWGSGGWGLGGWGDTCLLC